jgi:hypothetical protein
MGLRAKWVVLGGIATFLVVASVGCSSSDENAQGGSDRAFETTAGTSGSRLRARFVGSGAAKLLVGFHDNERNEDCTFQNAEAGKIRCLPESLAAQTGPELITFSDPACQSPVLIGVVPACTDTQYAIRTTSEFDPSCPGISKQSVRDIRKRDANVPATTYTNNANTGSPLAGCTAQPSQGQPQGTTGSTAAFTEVVPWTAFVEATETATPHDGGAIIERVLVATDGARQHIGYRAPINGGQSECSFHVMADGITRCVPDKGLGGPVAYSDTACQKPLFVRDFSSTRNSGCSSSSSSNSTAVESGLWIEPSNAICGGIGAVYSLADSFTGEDATTIFQWSAESRSTNPSNPTSPTEVTVSCKLNSVNPPSSSQQGIRSITTNLTGSLPSSRRWQNGGRGARLVSALVPNPTTTRGRDGFENQLQQGFHDSERNVDCTFELATDGKLHCLPVAASAVIFNSDQECKSADVVAVFSSSPCVASAKFARVTVPGTCPTVTKIYALDSAIPARDVPNVSTRVTADGCARVQQVIGAMNATEVDPAQFVEGATTTE